MKEVVLVILWFLLNAFIGLNILILFEKKAYLFFLERIALSFLVGVGIVSIEMFIMGLLGLSFRIGFILFPWIVLFLYNIKFSKINLKNNLNFGINSLSKLEIALLLFIFFEIIYTFSRALIKPMESYDCVAIYALKSKILYLANTVPKEFFIDLGRNFHGVHPDYPLLLPLTETWFYVFIGAFNDILAKVILPLLMSSFAVVFYFILKRILKDRSLSLLFTFALVSIKQFNDYATIHVADLILSIFYSLSLLYLFFWMDKKKDIFIILSVIFSILSLWTKNEGALLTAINIFILLSYLLKSKATLNKKTLSKCVISLIVIFIFAFSWLGYRSYAGLVNENFNISMIRIEYLKSHFKNIFLILYEYQRQIFGFKKWNLIWVILLFLLVTRFKESVDKNVFYITLAIFLFFLGYTFVYIFSTVEIDFFLKKTASRFFLHILPISVFWIALLTKEDNMKLSELLPGVSIILLAKSLRSLARAGGGRRRIKRIIY